jgi:hypothetical protein
MTPGTFACDIFGKYLESKQKDSTARTVTQQAFDHGFAVFMEDFIVNNKTFAKFDAPTQKRVIGALFFFHCTMPDVDTVKTFQSPADALELGKASKYSAEVAKCYADAVPVADVCERYLKKTYVWDGTSFLRWVETAWVHCEGESLNCDDLVECGGLFCDLRDCGLDTPLVGDALSDMSEFLSCFADDVEEFCQSEKFAAALASIKSKPVAFDKPSLLIPGYSTVLDASSGGVRKHSQRDHILTRLHYDVDQNETSVVTKLTRNFACDPTALATAILRCGVSTGQRTLTVISGPPASGRTTILKLVRALFDPYVCNGLEHDDGFDECVRACLCDDGSLSEEEIANHPCEHLLLVARSDVTLEGTFGGRTVTTLKLTGPVAQERVESTVLEHLTTRRQLGSLLGWCFSNCKLEKFQSSSPRSGGDDIMSMLAGLGAGCGDPSCPNCGGGRVTAVARGKGAMPPELLEMMKGGDGIGFSMSPDGELIPLTKEQMAGMHERAQESVPLDESNKPADSPSSSTPVTSEKVPAGSDSMPPLEDVQ